MIAMRMTWDSISFFMQAWPNTSSIKRRGRGITLSKQPYPIAIIQLSKRAHRSFYSDVQLLLALRYYFI